MVVTAPALVVPDEQTWTVWGADPAGADTEPVFEPSAVRRLLAPERVPQALAEPLAAVLDMLPGDVEVDDRHVPYPGDVSLRDLATDRDRPEHGGHEGHGGHDHGDMMAIVGEPSADGLVMEPIELRLGPVGTPLPAGLVADVTLDGDVVAGADVRALFGAEVERDVPDPLAPRAWELALSGARAPGRIAAVELERAVSHTAWLRSFARVLGWRELTERATRALARLQAAGSMQRPVLEQARRELDGIARFAESSRRLRWRTQGRGRVSRRRAEELGLRGPVARASGVPDDARSDDPLYRRLAFEPIVRTEGDALARTRVRTAEAVAAIELALAAVGSAPAPVPAGPGVVEGPRGPLHARAAGGERRLEAPGDDPALVAAAEAMVGAEWAAAVAILASFDLTPWRVAP